MYIMCNLPTKFFQAATKVTTYRRFRPEVLCNKSFLKHFAKIHRKSLMLGSEACNFIKNETPTRVSFCELCEIFKNTSGGCFST